MCSVIKNRLNIVRRFLTMLNFMRYLILQTGKVPEPSAERSDFLRREARDAKRLERTGGCFYRNPGIKLPL